MNSGILPATPKQVDILHALNAADTAIFYRKGEDSYTVRRRGRGAMFQVAQGDMDVMIHYGYIGRQDQRAVWFITERGKIALEEHSDG